MSASVPRGEDKGISERKIREESCWQIKTVKESKDIRKRKVARAVGSARTRSRESESNNIITLRSEKIQLVACTRVCLEFPQSGNYRNIGGNIWGKLILRRVCEYLLLIEQSNNLLIVDIYSSDPRTFCCFVTNELQFM